MLTTVTRAYTTELDLNDRQTTACTRHAGAARSAYNWGWHASRKRTQPPAKFLRRLICTVS
jgi:hypothetical protein